MRIKVKHYSTEIVVDEAVDSGMIGQYGSSYPTKIRFTDDHPYVIKTLEKMVEQLIKIRQSDDRSQQPQAQQSRQDVS